MDEQILVMLRGLAGKPMAAETSPGVPDDDFIPADAFGSNTDDCYDAGCEDGAIQLARRILGMLNQSTVS